MKSWMAIRFAVAIAGVAMAGSALALAQGPGGGLATARDLETIGLRLKELRISRRSWKWWNNPKLVAS